MKAAMGISIVFHSGLVNDKAILISKEHPNFMDNLAFPEINLKKSTDAIDAMAYAIHGASFRWKGTQSAFQQLIKSCEEIDPIETSLQLLESRITQFINVKLSFQNCVLNGKIESTSRKLDEQFDKLTEKYC